MLPHSSASAPSPLISVCIPTRNRSAYLTQAIESVLLQTVPHWELIISDSASTDATAETVKRFGDPRLRYLRWPDDRGMTANWLRAVEEASGRYLAILGDDDWWHPAFLEKGLHGLEDACHPDVVFSDHWLVDASGAILQKETQQCSHRHGRARMAGGQVDFIRSALEDQSLLPTASIFRRARFTELDLLSAQTQTSPAYYTYGKLALDGGTAWYVPERLAYYRLHRGSATNTTVVQNWKDFEWACARLAQEFPASTPGMALVRSAWRRALDTEGALHLRRREWREARRAFGRALAVARFHPTAWLGLLASSPATYEPYRWLRDRINGAAWA